ncbi:MAG TPA: hypothetical protein VM261_14280 [Kofleriaceae bacterium]|nr:hypothetical protein [Kofleriaceae bacterium]
MTASGPAPATDAELDALRENADLVPLFDALFDRGSRALDRGDWPAALRDLEEAAVVATLMGASGPAARARSTAALALRADGRLLAADRLMLG